MQSALTAALSAAIAVIVLPLFAAQSLSVPIAASFGLTESAAGLIAMMPMLGYTAGLVLLVPLIDIFRMRSVMLTTLLTGTLALAAAAYSPSATLFLLSAFIVGLTTSATQMVVPLAAGLAEPAARGRVIGKVMSGLMIGVLLSRPSANLSASLFGWRGAYLADAAALAVVCLACALIVPARSQSSRLSFLELVSSLWIVLRSEPVLQRRAACQALCMGAFGAFWTGVPLLLAAPPFGLGQIGIGAFALAGIGGAIVAPVAGWAADRRLDETATRLAHLCVIAGSGLALIFGADRLGFDPAMHRGTALLLLVLAAVIVDLGVIGDQTLGRHAVNSLRPEIRGRLNGLYTGLFFLGGAAGSALAGVAWTHDGWAAVCALCVGFGLAALALGWITSRQRIRRDAGVPAEATPARPDVRRIESRF
ncbi:putative MFS family arabinose efflux permease [Bradyrhizobium macuxiense]|uniref:Putative MFS family arabinose efflux permease n=1 Tax=Bradyrhizobium macuxiense TaxID=1755647 RepID=A0A560LNZ6_9BRAD|nr:MFS transporter [Bradyrhizobium macuxiense]TWB96995.1 putative MFS family arabinose efflux permease [Bradyrhizobium macuxiense]